MTIRPVVMTLVRENRLSQLVSELGALPVISNGNCGPDSADLFFSDAPEEIAAALDLCSSCPAKAKCLQAALRGNELGVWGGTTQEERLVSTDPNQESEIPSTQEAVVELNNILTMSPADLSLKYRVDRRTVSRWKNYVKASSDAMLLVGLK